MDVQKLIDEERGYLDRKNVLGCGFSGPITDDYLRGYGVDPMEARRASASAEFKNNYVDHGWY